MRRLALTLTLLLAAGMMAGMGAAAQASTHNSHFPRDRFEFDHHTCFEGPHAKDHTKPGGACWSGAICLHPTSFFSGDTGVWCMGQRRKNQKHPAEGRVVALRNEATKAHEWFVVDLVGYVTYDPGNPIPGHDFWPFRDPNLDHVFDGYPVVQLVYIPGGPPIGHSIRVECVQDLSIGLNHPASFGGCGKNAQFHRDLHDTYFVWPSPGHRIEAVHITNAEGSKAPICLFADDPAAGPAPWFVRLRHPEIASLTGELQFWEERKIHA